MNALHRRIIDISYKHKLSHIGSCLTAVDIIDEIFKAKKPDEKFVLSSGHAGLALYVVLEKYEGVNAEELLETCGIHPDRLHPAIDCSTGSLGQGLPIAVGMALADRSKNVYCLISDGECAEGSIYEALRIMDENKLDNLKVYLNYNGYGAYKETNPKYMPDVVNVHFTNFDELMPVLREPQEAHYKQLSREEYDIIVSNDTKKKVPNL